MKREETVEEVEKNTEWQRRTPKRKASGPNPLGRTQKERHDENRVSLFWVPLSE